MKNWPKKLVAPDDYSLARLGRLTKNAEAKKKKEITSIDDLKNKYAEINENRRDVSKKIAGPKGGALRSDGTLGKLFKPKKSGVA